MGVCKKTFGEMWMATLILIGIIVGSGLTIVGVKQRNTANDTGLSAKLDEAYIILGSLITGVVSIAVVAMLLYKTEIGMIQIILLLGVFICGVLEIYSANYFETDPADAFTYIVVAFGILFRIVTLMIGYGRCEIPDIMGGKFK